MVVQGFYVGGIGGGGTASSGAGIATRDIVTASNLMVWTSATAVQRNGTVRFWFSGVVVHLCQGHRRRWRW